MAKKSGLENLVGKWVFLIGVVIALVVGLMDLSDSRVTIALLIIGLIVGLFNVSGSETASFLMSGVVLIIASAFGGDVFSIVPQIQGVFVALLAIFTPATVIVAVKNVFSIARD